MLTAKAGTARTTADNPDIGIDRFFWRSVDDSIFVVDLNRFEFTILNASAALLWLCLLDQSRTRAELATILATAFGETSNTVSADVDVTLDAWTRIGWIESLANGNVTIASHTTEQRPLPYRVTDRETFDRTVSAVRDEWLINCDLIGQPVSIHFKCDPGLENSDISRRARSFLDGIPRSEVAAPSPIICNVTGDGIFLRRENICIHAADISDGISRIVLWAFYAGYDADNMLGTFHAAAVGNDEGAILMPGLSGRGKSTLTAFLSANGWFYGGDDIIGLGRPATDDTRYLVLPFFSALSVKEASVPVLAPLYPGLESLPELAYDKKRARFLTIPEERLMDAQTGPRRIRAIVFPHFDTSAAPATITSLTSRDALVALAGVGYRTGERMDSRLLGGLIDFLQTTPKYRLHFSDLASAAQILKGLP